MNQNTEYEKFAQEVYRELCMVEGIKTSAIRHNIRLTGESGCKHQIDVYWEYELSGIKHKVAIECKNYTHSVSIRNVRDFFGVLYDLEDTAGIMVTQKGYQKGAKKYAAYVGINLIELRKPNESDGWIGKITLQLDEHIRHCLFLVDEKWAKDNNIDISIHRKFLSSFTSNREWLNNDYIPLQTLPDANILDKTRRIISTFKELENKLPPEGTVTEHIFKFEDAYVDTIHGLVKILEVKFQYEKRCDTKVFGLDARDFVKAVLKDAINGEIKMIGKYGSGV